MNKVNFINFTKSLLHLNIYEKVEPQRVYFIKGENLKFLVLIILLCTQSAFARSNQESRKLLSEPHNPVIIEDTLYITGVIDSHIYDFIAWAGSDLNTVTKVSLNSFGGNSKWALEIGRKIRSLGFNTKVEKGSFCASACIYILGSGHHRSVHESVWLGIHGARLGAVVFSDIAGVCSDQSSNKLINVNLHLSDCQQTIDKWYNVAKKTTDDSFDLLESSGVLKELRNTYYSLEEQKDWFTKGNVLRIKDWVLTPTSAKHFLLIHDILVDEF